MPAETYTHPDGNVRHLGLNPTPPEKRKLFGAQPYDIVPQSDWRDIDRRAIYGDDIKYWPYQNGFGACVGASEAEALSKIHHLLGQPYVKLSGAYAYSLINGGRDSGASIGDALEAAMNHGCCTDASCPMNSHNIYRRNTADYDAEAARFKLSKGVTINNQEEAATVLLRGGILQFGVCASRHFGSTDSNGVQQQCDKGGCNHSVHADGLKKVGDRWCLDLVTWTERFYYPLEFTEEVGFQEMFAHVAAVDDPSDQHTPPTPV